MASELIKVIAELAPYLEPVMKKHGVSSYKEMMEVGEPYLSLLWLFGSAALPEAHVPRDVLIDAISTLDEGDKETYGHLLDHSS